MVIGRKVSLARAVDLIQSGISVDIVGGRGSGRSAFLGSLKERLEHSEWTVVSIRGVASLRQHPLAALHLAGIGEGARPLQGLPDTAAALRAKLRHPRSVLFLDDWDDLDESSWGVAESVRRTVGVPIVLSRLQGLRARHTPTGLSASTIDPSYVIEMGPLRFDEMEQALTDYLQAPIEASTMSRIYAKTGGNIGLAVSLLDATTREGSLVLRRSREWVAVRDLWSPALKTVLDGYLESLDGHTRDALEIIGIVGIASLETVKKLVDWDALELLEERSMIMFIANGSSQLVAVIPPLLVEYFRHEPLNARRIRLTELIVQRLGATESAAAILQEPIVQRVGTPEREALFVRLLHERARARRIVTAAEWESAPTAGTAARYVAALVDTYTPSVDAAVRNVLSTTSEDAGEPADRAAFAALRARWAAYVDHDLDGARTILDHSRPGLGPYEGILDAADVEITYSVDSLPADFADRLEVTDDLPAVVKAELLQTQLLILVGTARFADARRVCDELDALLVAKHRSVPRVLDAIALLGQGDHARALEILVRGMDEAQSYLDIEGVRTFGAGVAMCHVHSGDHAALDDLLEAIFAAGDPTPFPAGTQLSLLAIGAIAAVRQGRIAAGERLASDIDKLKGPDGPLPGQARAWAHVQLRAFEGQAEQAADLLWESSVALERRGALFAALLGMLDAIEIHPSAERLAEVDIQLARVPEATPLHAHRDYLAGVIDNDPAQILTAAQALDRAGRVGVALAACQQAIALAGQHGHDGIQRRAAEIHDRIRAANGSSSFDTSRFTASTVVLTEREKEVARLAAEGLSNQEIATRLVLSVRTVESHMHRVMRKLEINSRHVLGEHLDGALS